VQSQNSTSTLAQLTPKYLMEYSYAWAYNRTVLSTPAGMSPTSSLWNESRNIQIPITLKTESEALFAQLAGNGFRMSMFLQMDQLDATGANALTPGQLTLLRDEWLNDRPNENSTAVPKPIIKGGLYAMYRHFAAHHPGTLADDEQLILALMAKLGLTAKTW
jgi:hypothetical protein